MAAFQGLFGGSPKIPKIPAPPKPPVLDEAAQQADQADQIRKRRGIAADMITGTGGVRTMPNVGTATLLGQ